MPFLLDTTVLIDVVRRFAPTVRWLAAKSLADLYVSSITVGEIHFGAWLRHPSNGRARDAEIRGFEAGPLALLNDRVLAFDRPAAVVWGRLLGQGGAVGRMPPKGDAQIAAIALHHGLTVVTSNTPHFTGIVPIVDPRTA